MDSSRSLRRSSTSPTSPLEESEMDVDWQLRSLLEPSESVSEIRPASSAAVCSSRLPQTAVPSSWLLRRATSTKTSRRRSYPQTSSQPRTSSLLSTTPLASSSPSLPLSPPCTPSNHLHPQEQGRRRSRLDGEASRRRHLPRNRPRSSLPPSIPSLANPALPSSSLARAEGRSTRTEMSMRECGALPPSWD